MRPLGGGAGQKAGGERAPQREVDRMRVGGGGAVERGE